MAGLLLEFDEAELADEVDDDPVDAEEAEADDEEDTDDDEEFPVLLDSDELKSSVS